VSQWPVAVALAWLAWNDRSVVRLWITKAGKEAVKNRKQKWRKAS